MPRSRLVAAHDRGGSFIELSPVAGVQPMQAAVYEPRYVLEIAQLLNLRGDNDAAKHEYQRFLDFWKNADPGLSEVADARRMINRR